MTFIICGRLLTKLSLPRHGASLYIEDEEFSLPTLLLIITPNAHADWIIDQDVIFIACWLSTKLRTTSLSQTDLMSSSEAELNSSDTNRFSYKLLNIIECSIVVITVA